MILFLYFCYQYKLTQQPLEVLSILLSSVHFWVMATFLCNVQGNSYYVSLLWHNLTFKFWALGVRTVSVLETGKRIRILHCSSWHQPFALLLLLFVGNHFHITLDSMPFFAFKCFTVCFPRKRVLFPSMTVQLAKF